MPLFSFEGKSPKVHPSAFVAPTAVLVGDVTVEENASVWYNAVLRADFNPIVVRRGANVQDCAVVHVTPRQRSEEHTSELQSQSNLVCRLLLEKKKIHKYLSAGAPHHPTALFSRVPATSHSI